MPTLLSRIELIALLLAASLVAGMGGSAIAQETSAGGDQDNIHIGRGVICDTQEQATRFTMLIVDRELDQALVMVNREVANPSACGMAVIAFRSGKEVADIHNDKGTFKIIEIVVMAAATDEGWHMVAPRTQYTAVSEIGMKI